VIALFGAGLAAAAVVVWMVLVPPATPPADPSRWLLLPVEGAPSLEGEPVSSASRFTAGSIVATDGASRAELIHSGIGRLELSPNTIVSFLSAGEGEQRFSLERGTLTASTWVPPRVFIVETAAATAVDMGCAYRLDVADDGTGQLLVTSGLVLLESHGRQSWVPDAALCRMKPGRGPGTPHAEQSSSHFRELLDAFDFDGAPIAPVIDAAADVDAITLWHLLRRAAPADRPAVYSKLAAFVPPPEGVTPEGISRLDDTMLDGWWEEILVSGPRAPGT
jgi:hypothetical protein